MLKNKVIKFTIFIILSILLIMVSINIPYEFILFLDDNSVLTADEFNKIRENDFFKVSSLAYAANSEVDEEEIKQYEVQYKLFNLFNIKNLKINVIGKSNVFAGGNCLGFTLEGKGLIVVGGSFVLTKNGPVNPFKAGGLAIGDVITKVNDKDVVKIGDLMDIMDSLKSNDALKIGVVRNGENIVLEISPSLCNQTNKYKLGLWLKDNTVGIGTLTFVNDHTKRFGSLGHSITTDSKSAFEISGGEIFSCDVVGVKESASGVAGQLIGIFSLNDEKKGNVDKNCKFGVYGSVNSNYYYKNKKPVDIGGRFTAKPGNAKILSCVDGENVKEYDIEIIKTNQQKSPLEKSMVIRVIDKELLKTTGGIVQGMSGSPIIQEDKLVGAVTHVFLNDSTKGFGVYIDWMIDL